MIALVINLVVSDLERSRAFYAALGCEFRPIRSAGSAENLTASDDVLAWMGIEGLPVTVHRQDFAQWWNTTGAMVSPGSAVIDMTVDRDAALALLDAVPEHGGEVLQPWRDMAWGQAYAIFADPDGYRWGIKTDPAS